MPEWWEGDPVVSPARGSVRPVNDWWGADPIVKDRGAQPRIPIGVDPRHDLDLAFNEDETRQAAGSAAAGLTVMGTAAIPGLGAAGGAALRLVGNPYAGAAYAGGHTLLETGDLSKAGAAAAGTYITQKGLGKAVGAVGRWISKSLKARLAHQVARAAMAEAPAAVTAGTEAAPTVAKAAAPAVAKTLPPMQNASREAVQERAAARTARQLAPRVEALGNDDVLISLGPVADPIGTLAAKLTPAGAHVQQVTVVPAARRQGHATALYRKLGELMREKGVTNFTRDEMVQPGAEATVAKLRAAAKAVATQPAPVVKATSMPVKGNIKMATVYTRPKGAPPTRSEAVTTLQTSGRRSLGEEQLAAAKAAGVDIGEAFGAKVAPVAQAEKAAESALETRLRASMLMQKDKAALASEIGEKVLALKQAGGKGATADKISAVIEEQYGLPLANVRQMVAMVFQSQGLR